MSQYKEKRKKIGFWVFLSCIIVFVLMIAECKKDTPDFVALWQNCFLSIFCSILASGIFGLLQTSSEEDSRANEMLELKKIDKELVTVNEQLKIEKDLYDSGIVSIRRKSYYDAEGKFWKNIINTTSNKLDLIGHTISDWFGAEYKTTFVNKILEMLKAGNPVRIILSGNAPNMEQILKVEANGRETSSCRLETKMDRTCMELRKIYKQADKKNRDNLQVYITDSEKVTYMYIRTDKQCFISPYITNKSNDANTFLLELKPRIEYTKCFDDDFEELLKITTQQLDFGGL